MMKTMAEVKKEFVGDLKEFFLLVSGGVVAIFHFAGLYFVLYKAMSALMSSLHLTAFELVVLLIVLFYVVLPILCDLFNNKPSGEN